MKPLLLLPLILLPGCASVVQTATTTATNPTNGVVTVTEARRVAATATHMRDPAHIA